MEKVKVLEAFWGGGVLEKGAARRTGQPLCSPLQPLQLTEEASWPS